MSRTFLNNRTKTRVPRASAIATVALASLAVIAPTGPANADPLPPTPRDTVTAGGVISPYEAAPTGWASVAGGTTGGTGAPSSSIYTVTSRAELKAALANGGAPDEPKIIYIRGVINGNEAPDGTIMTEQDYAPGYDLDKYMSCFIDGGKQWSDQAFDYCKDMRHLRQNGSNAMKRLIEVNVPSNTTLLGVGPDSGFVGANLVFHNVSNVIVRNLAVEAPVSYFTSWSPDDGDGAWNARFDTISSITSDHLWFDHILASDGRFPDSEAPIGFRGQPVIRHDGLLDLKDGTDYVTISRSQFRNHDKTSLLGSGDEHVDTDAGRLRVTFIANLFENTQERSPRVRFGQVQSGQQLLRRQHERPAVPDDQLRSGRNALLHRCRLRVEDLLGEQSLRLLRPRCQPCDHRLQLQRLSVLRPRVVVQRRSDRRQCARSAVIRGQQSGNSGGRRGVRDARSRLDAE